MKKIIILLTFLLFLSLNMFANPVDREEAQKCAVNFYTYNAPEGVFDFSVKDVIIHTYSGKTSFYTFVFQSGGFVLISADDYVRPVLAYSFTGNVDRDDKNPALGYKLESYKKQIEHAKTLKAKDENLSKMWEGLRSNTLTEKLKAGPYLLSTTWNQSPIYNMYCPPNTPTGCVATAMAQIMNFHKWPQTGRGFHAYVPSGSPVYGKQAADFASGNYDWTNMPNILSQSSTEQQKTAVAKLMYHCGVSVDMNYKTDGSGAYSEDVVYSLTNYFLYDHSGIELINFNVAQETAWLSKIKNEIDNGRPVYYAGSSEEDGGHAWVCDGYDSFNNLHINWGWGGSYDGYFAASAMNPGNYSFSEYNSAIIGIKPGNVSQPMLWVKQASGFSTPSRGIRYISALDKRTAWAVAYDGTSAGTAVKEYTKTVNGGETWVYGTINAPGSEGYESAMICAIDENTAWVPLFGPNGGGMITKTSDGGKTWIKQGTATFSAPDGFPNIVHFWDQNHGFCQGDPNGGFFEIYTTSNGGDTWTRVPQANIPANLFQEYGTIGYYDVVGDTVWFATNKGRIYRSVNKGLNWQVFQTPISDASFEISFKNATTGIIQIRKSGQNSAYITQNGGNTWSNLNFTGNFYNNSFKFVRSTGMLITTGSDYDGLLTGVSYSTNDGTSFTDFADYYKKYQFLALGVSDDEGIWAGGFNFNQYKNGFWHFGERPFTSAFRSDKKQLCNAEQVSFYNESVGFPDGWEWDFGTDANPPTALGAGPHTVTFGSDGGKNIRLTVSRNGEFHTKIKENMVYVASSLPSAPGTITGSTQVNAGMKYDYSVQNVPENTYKWTMPPIYWTGTSETNQVQVSFSYYAKSDTLRVAAKNGCGESDKSQLVITVLGSLGFDEVSKSDNFTIYPNPASEKLYIKDSEGVEIQIINSQGSMVYVKKLNASLEEINISKLVPGVYFIKIPDKGRFVYKPFSKI